MAELQEQVTAQSQEQAILQRALEDRAAEVEVERVGAKVGERRGGARLGLPAALQEENPALYLNLPGPAYGAESGSGGPAAAAAADGLSRGPAEASGRHSQQVWGQRGVCPPVPSSGW